MLYATINILCAFAGAGAVAISYFVAALYKNHVLQRELRKQLDATK